MDGIVKTKYIVLTHYYHDIQSGTRKYVKMLHKANNTFMGGYFTDCYMRRQCENDGSAVFKEDISDQKLSQTVKGAGNYKKVCPYCFPNGLER